MSTEKTYRLLDMTQPDVSFAVLVTPKQAVQVTFVDGHFRTSDAKLQASMEIPDWADYFTEVEAEAEVPVRRPVVGAKR